MNNREIRAIFEIETNIDERLVRRAIERALKDIKRDINLALPLGSEIDIRLLKVERLKDGFEV